MTDLQLELTKLIGSKELSFGCKLIRHWNEWDIIYDFLWFYDPGIICTYYECVQRWKTVKIPENRDTEIIGHPATLSDFEQFIFSLGNLHIEKWNDEFIVKRTFKILLDIDYDWTKKLLQQTDEILEEIIDFIKANQ